MARTRQDTTSLHLRNRRFPRKSVALAAEFSPVNIKLNVPHNISTVSGLVKNMSTAGVFVELPTLYRVGTRFQVRFMIGDKPLSFYAIVWRIDLRQEMEQPSTYGHGMKITTASDSTLHTIMNFINGE